MAKASAPYVAGVALRVRLRHDRLPYDDTLVDLPMLLSA